MSQKEFTLSETSGIRIGREKLPPTLQPFIHEYYEETFTVPDGSQIPICATSDPYLNVTTSGILKVISAGGIPVPPVIIAGPQPEPCVLEASGCIYWFYVHFTTVGPLALLGVDDYSLTENGLRPLHEMVRKEIAQETYEWGQALLAASSFGERVELTNRFLLAHQLPITPQVAFLQAAVGAIKEVHGNIRMDDLAQRLGTSVSTLRRHFRVLGMPPKHFARVVRFRHAHAYLNSIPNTHWPDVVAMFGYSDQPHFIREYRRFSGGPPSGWEPRVRAIDRRMGIEQEFDGVSG